MLLTGAKDIKTPSPPPQPRTLTPPSPTNSTLSLILILLPPSNSLTSLHLLCGLPLPLFPPTLFHLPFRRIPFPFLDTLISHPHLPLILSYTS